MLLSVITHWTPINPWTTCNRRWTVSSVSPLCAACVSNVICVTVSSVICDEYDSESDSNTGSVMSHSIPIHFVTIQMLSDETLHTT